MASPPRRLEPSPNRSQDLSTRHRPALAQRSQSQLNSGNTPSIRLVPELDVDIYAKSPFPQLPSQILAPRHAPGSGSYLDRRQGKTIGNENYTTISTTPPQNTRATANVTAVPKPLQLRRAPARASLTSTTSSSADDSGIDVSPLPSSVLLSHPSTPATTISGRTSSASIHNLLPSLLEDPLPEKEEPSGISRSSEALQTTIRLVNPADISSSRPVTALQSSPSPPSSPPEEAFTPRQQAGPSSSSPPNYVVIQESSSPQSISTPDSLPRFAKSRPIVYESVESLAFSDSSAAEYPILSSSPAPASTTTPVSNVAAIVATFEKGTNVQYPVVKPPSASGSWAEVSKPSSRFIPAPSMSEDSDDDYRPPPWTSRLSTIASESEPSPTRQQSRRQTIQSVLSTNDGATVSDVSASPIAYPAPLFTIGGRPQTVLESRTSEEEGDDTLGELQPPPLRSQRSGFLRPFSNKSRPSSSDSMRSQASGISFMGDLSWARRYYSGSGLPPNNTSTPELTKHISSSGDSRIPTTVGTDSRFYTTSTAASSRVGTSHSERSGSPTSESFPTSVYVPRRRPRQAAENNGTFLISEGSSDSLAIAPNPIVRPLPQSPESLAPPPATATSVVTPPTVRDLGGHKFFSPHLRQDRRQQNYGAWRAPSFDEPYGELFLGQVNRQIWLFCLGFVFPVAWFLAAMLPIPRSAEDLETETEKAESTRLNTANTVSTTTTARTHRTSQASRTRRTSQVRTSQRQRTHRASQASRTSQPTRTRSAQEVRVVRRSQSTQAPRTTRQSRTPRELESAINSQRLRHVRTRNTSIENMADIDEKRHQKARWWRILNRIMVIPGIIIIAAVIALGVVAGRMHSG